MRFHRKAMLERNNQDVGLDGYDDIEESNTSDARFALPLEHLKIQQMIITNIT